jgi:hypothetical protein
LQVVEEIREIPEEPEKSSGNTSDPARMDVDKAPVNTDTPNPDNQPVASTLQVPSSSLALITSQHESGAPSSSGTGGPNFDEEIARILLPLSQRTAEATDATDNAEDLAFMKIMAIGFKGVQERYSQRWNRVRKSAKLRIWLTRN